MEKVKVTQEQAKAIERYPNKDDLMKAKLIGLLEHGKDESIAELSNKELARALYVGYEVEPEFKVGNWVVDTLNNYTFRIHAVVNHRVVPDWFEGTYDKGNTDESDWIPIGYLRHATPEEIAKEKERRWWAKHGRDVWELKKGDVLKHEYYITYVAGVDSFEYVIVGDEDEIRVYKDDHERLERIFKVVCFAEDRKDKGQGA